MATFNIELWQKIKNDFSDLNKKVYFGEVPEDVEAAFSVLHVIDSGIDDTYTTLCNEDKVYKSDIQISLYDYNDMVIDEILDKLNTFIKQLNNLTTYRIIKKERVRTRNSNGFSAELGMGYTEYVFTYEKL